MINAEAVSRRDAEIVENLLSEQVLDAAIEVHRTLVGFVINFGQGRLIYTNNFKSWVLASSLADAFEACLHRSTYLS